MENIACNGVFDEARARDNVCLRDDDKPLGDSVACRMDGDGGRACWVGDGGLPLRKGVELADAELLLPFFLLLNGRRNDQSDSNWTDSNSEDRAE